MFTMHVFCETVMNLSVPSFPIGFEAGMWDSNVLTPA